MDPTDENSNRDDSSLVDVESADTVDNNKSEITNNPYKRDEKGRLLPGHSGGPGRPKGKTLKEFARAYYLLKTDEEKIEYINNLEEKKPGFAWTMAEGNPHQSSDQEHKGEININISKEVSDKHEINSSTGDNS